MRTRAGIILIEEDKVALIERHRAGMHYYVFPGGGVDEGETPEQGAIRETLEELGIDVVIKQKVVIIHFGKSTQIYYLVEKVGGEFGTGTGEEYTDADPFDPTEGVYSPVWMSMDEMSKREKIYPEYVKKLVLKAAIDGWPDTPVVIYEKA